MYSNSALVSTKLNLGKAAKWLDRWIMSSKSISNSKRKNDLEGNEEKLWIALYINSVQTAKDDPRKVSHAA